MSRSGANVPALNDVLDRYGIRLGGRVYGGTLRVGSRFSSQSAKFASGAALSRFPKGGYLSFHQLTDLTPELLGSTAREPSTAPVEDTGSASGDGSATESEAPRWEEPGISRVAVIGGYVTACVCVRGRFRRWRYPFRGD